MLASALFKAQIRKHMIQITVNEAVYEALHQAFPTSYNSRRVLNKYIKVLEGLLFLSLQWGLTPAQRKLSLFQFL